MHQFYSKKFLYFILIFETSYLKYRKLIIKIQINFKQQKSKLFFNIKNNLKELIYNKVHRHHTLSNIFQKPFVESYLFLTKFQYPNIIIPRQNHVKMFTQNNKDKKTQQQSYAEQQFDFLDIDDIEQSKPKQKVNPQNEKTIQQNNATDNLKNLSENNFMFLGDIQSKQLDKNISSTIKPSETLKLEKVSSNVMILENQSLKQDKLEQVVPISGIRPGRLGAGEGRRLVRKGANNNNKKSEQSQKVQQRPAIKITDSIKQPNSSQIISSDTKNMLSFQNPSSGGDTFINISDKPLQSKLDQGSQPSPKVKIQRTQSFDMEPVEKKNVDSFLKNSSSINNDSEELDRKYFIVSKNQSQAQKGQMNLTSSIILKSKNQKQEEFIKPSQIVSQEQHKMDNSFSEPIKTQVQNIQKTVEQQKHLTINNQQTKKQSQSIQNKSQNQKGQQIFSKQIQLIKHQSRGGKTIHQVQSIQMSASLERSAQMTSSITKPMPLIKSKQLQRKKTYQKQDQIKNNSQNYDYQVKQFNVGRNLSKEDNISDLLDVKNISELVQEENKKQKEEESRGTAEEKQKQPEQKRIQQKKEEIQQNKFNLSRSKKQQFLKQQLLTINFGQKQKSKVLLHQKQKVQLSSQNIIPLSSHKQQKQPINQSITQHNKVKQHKKSVSLKFSIIQVEELQPNISDKVSLINKFTSKFDNEWKSSKISCGETYGASSASLVQYYGYSWDKIIDSSNNFSKQENINKSKLTRDMLLGPKSKQKRQLFKQQEKQLSLKQNKKLFYYVEPDLRMINDINLKSDKVKHTDFYHSFNFQQRLNAVLDMIEILSIFHKQGYMIFPNSLCTNQSSQSHQDKRVLYYKSHTFDNNEKPKLQLKIAVHSLEPFGNFVSTSKKQFKLQQFVQHFLSSILSKQKQQQKQLHSKIKTQRPQLKTNLYSPQIRFNSTQWYWQIFNINVKSYLDKEKKQISELNAFLTPTWVDLFEISFNCLKLLFGEQLIQKMIQLRYEEIEKQVDKVIKDKQKAKPQEVKKGTKLPVGKQKIVKQKQLQIAQQKTDQSSFYSQIYQQLTKTLQKPLITWLQLQKSYKQQAIINEKLKQKNTNGPKINTISQNKQFKIDFNNVVLKQVFQILSGSLWVLPFGTKNNGKAQKLQLQRITSLKVLNEKLHKYKKLQLNLVKVPAILSSQGKQITQKNQSKISDNYSKSPLSIFSHYNPVTSALLTQLKQKYLELNSSLANLVSKQDFTKLYTKNQSTHLINVQVKKKLVALFLSISGIMKSPKSFNLIYKASVFGFSSKKFYQYIQKRQKLLYVLKIKDDKTIYYYTQQKINRTKHLNGIFGGWVKDTKGNSFIYTGQEVLKVKNPAKSFGVSHIYGPIIGEGDIVIKQNNIDNECNHPRSYQATKKGKKIFKSNRFVLDEMDVYQVSF